jgi:hypothetical protein
MAFLPGFSMNLEKPALAPATTSRILETNRRSFCPPAGEPRPFIPCVSAMLLPIPEPLNEVTGSAQRAPVTDGR